MWPFGKSKKPEKQEETQKKKNGYDQKRYAQYAGSSILIRQQIEEYTKTLIKETAAFLDRMPESHSPRKPRSFVDNIARDLKFAANDIAEWGESVGDSISDGFNSAKKEVSRWGDKAADKTKSYAEGLVQDIIPEDQRYRDYLILVSSKVLNKYAPKQDSPQWQKDLVVGAANMMMSDYDGKLTEETILSNMDKEFLPQPKMAEVWAKSQGFEIIDNKGESHLNPSDVAGKYVLTYYESFANSWQERVSGEPEDKANWPDRNDSNDKGSDNNDITNNPKLKDMANKHWYSHCKSAIFDDNGVAQGASNPELLYNDTKHDATYYVPKDSTSFVIDYERFGLKKQDITEGFTYLSEGINVLQKDMRDSIFRMKDAGLEPEEIVNLWKDGVKFDDPKNIETIENHFKNGGKKEELSNCEFSKVENGYRYNLQDNSCAIQPTAPLLFAAEAKIHNEKMSPEQANGLRENIGLYNIHDLENYGKINKNSYAAYDKHVTDEFHRALDEDMKKLKKKGCKMLRRGAMATALVPIIPSPTVVACCATYIDNLMHKDSKRERPKERHRPTSHNHNQEQALQNSALLQFAYTQQAEK